ncbi:hypothetical protein TRICHSKD4_2700 [Roseibium sp. TrichSKD4]|nr:hypothetical protein TRICHSKD4_2700 [Roseibium sp. TrichSKD4]
MFGDFVMRRSSEILSSDLFLNALSLLRKIQRETVELKNIR